MYYFCFFRKNYQSMFADRILLFLFSVIFSLTLAAQQRGLSPVSVTIGNKETKLYDQSHALIIGISSYDRYDNGWNALKGVRKDIEEVRLVLELNGFNVVVHEDGTKEQIEKVISEFIRDYGMGRDNRLLFYFAGHGYTINTPFSEKLGYFVPVDAPNPVRDTAGFQSKSIEMAQIEIYAKRIFAKHALFVFDACFAGSLFNVRSPVSEAITYRTANPVRQFITSGTADQQVPDESIFREQFVIALTSDEADFDKDGYITGSELGYFLSSRVVNYSYNTQHPQYAKIRNPNLDKGDFVFKLPAPSASLAGQAGSTEKTAVRVVQEPAVSEATVQNQTQKSQPGTSVVTEKRVAAKPVEDVPRAKETSIVLSAVPQQQITVEDVADVQVGHLEVSSEIAGDIFVDGLKRRTIKVNGTEFIRNVKPGTHIVELRGDQTFHYELEVIANEINRVRFSKLVAFLYDYFNVTAPGINIEVRGIKGGAVGSGVEKQVDKDLPNKEIKVLSDFAIMKYEVTVAEFKAFVDETGYRTDADQRSGGFGSIVLRNNTPVEMETANWMYSSEGSLRSQVTYNHPVVHVSWNDAVAYAEWLTEKTGRVWRLPTEAEWEYAARGGESFRFAGGDTIADVAWYWRNSNKGTQAVGLKRPNGYGLYDMSGNVREWCLDPVARTDIGKQQTQSDEPVINNPLRVAMGGSSDVMEQFCQVTSRDIFEQTFRNHNIGFRLVLLP